MLDRAHRIIFQGTSCNCLFFSLSEKLSTNRPRKDFSKSPSGNDRHSLTLSKNIVRFSCFQYVCALTGKAKRNKKGSQSIGAVSLPPDGSPSPDGRDTPSDSEVPWSDEYVLVFIVIMGTPCRLSFFFPFCVIPKPVLKVFFPVRVHLCAVCVMCDV